MWKIGHTKSDARREGSGGSCSDRGLASQECFAQMLHIEQKRTERSSRCFVLMLLEFASIPAAKQSRTIEKALSAVSSSIRETDMKGWYKDGSVLGIVFTEIEPAESEAIANALVTKIRGVLAAALAEQDRFIQISITIFPRDWDKKGSGDFPGSEVPAELRGNPSRKRAALTAKRMLDIVGSVLALILFLPFFVVIAVAIKFTSKGPVLFRQQRVGQYGRRFQFLKFRSMHTGNNQAIHQAFVQELIAGTGSSEKPGEQRPVYKITNDPRITSIGGFLRRTSLDELPQFLNVLAGQMSLVGPRPPIPYEVACYEIWHWRRLLAVKPGITGLWQVKGRSRTTFDEMVRLDLQYARTWSVWMDLRILLQTPRAMVSGDGAH
jgi:exopolysaccharide biosynthesis polyprenyl glycosylphosphotransferase